MSWFTENTLWCIVWLRMDTKIPRIQLRLSKHPFYQYIKFCCCPLCYCTTGGAANKIIDLQNVLAWWVHSYKRIRQITCSDYNTTLLLDRNGSHFIREQLLVSPSSLVQLGNPAWQQINLLTFFVSIVLQILMKRIRYQSAVLVRIQLDVMLLITARLKVWDVGSWEERKWKKLLTPSQLSCI